MNELFKGYTVKDIIRLGGSRYLKGIVEKDILSEYIADLKFYADTYPSLEGETFHELFMFGEELLDIHKAVTAWCKAQQVTQADIDEIAASVSSDTIDALKSHQTSVFMRSYQDAATNVRKLEEQAEAYRRAALGHLKKVEQIEATFDNTLVYRSMAEAAKSYFMHIHEGSIYLIDKHNLSITHDAGAIGSKQRIIGRFLYHINPTGVLKVFPWSGNLVSIGNTSYWHPHIGNMGGVCLGDGSYAFSESYPFVGKMMKIVRAIMITYNASSPYVGLSYMRKVTKTHSFRYSYPTSFNFITSDFVKKYYAVFGTIPVQHYNVFNEFMNVMSSKLDDKRFDDIDNDTIMEELEPTKDYTLSEIEDAIKEYLKGAEEAEEFKQAPSVFESNGLTPSGVYVDEAEALSADSIIHQAFMHAAAPYGEEEDVT